ncbi:MAG: hypothetical protein QGD92_11500 [Gammaproteobacteria bacterium]|nr:hypothetical protein [Gammaproteobacteria bacterium]
MSVLATISVLDLSAGPARGMATMIMADFGADVMGASFLADRGARAIKVEPIGAIPFATCLPDLALHERTHI